jgi:acetoin utilization protein AcuC
MTLPIIYREELQEYDFGPGHPFRGDRYDMFPQYLRQKLVEGEDYRFIEAEPVGDDELRLICQQDYIDVCRDYYRAAHLGLDYAGDFTRFLSPDNIPRGRPGKVEEAARLIIGQVKAAADLVVTGDEPGVVVLGGGLHHAKASYGEGFCIYNDVAFCARYLRRVHGLERVMVLDTDAHAGNGTAEYFYDEPSVLLIDIHQDPRTLYPGTGFAHQIGAGSGSGFTINVPMPPFSGEEAYRLVFKEIVRPVVEEFGPQVIIRNGGSDPHAGDELTNLGLQVKDFRMIGEQVREMVENCGGSEIDLIASGYTRQILPPAWLALICGVAGINIDIEEPGPFTDWPGGYSPEDVNSVIQTVKNHLKEYWRCLRRD